MEFLQYYHLNGQHIRLVDKQKSWLMKTINFFLMLAGKLKIASIQDFMTRYVTTIGHSIYASPKWQWADPCKRRTVHELTHVEQWGLWYALTYIFSPDYRIRYESICVQAEMLCYPDDYDTDKDLMTRAEHFVPYGVKYDRCLEEIVERKLEVTNGHPQPAAKRMSDLYHNYLKELSPKL